MLCSLQSWELIAKIISVIQVIGVLIVFFSSFCEPQLQKKLKVAKKGTKWC